MAEDVAPGLAALATHLPVWGTDERREAGADEDAVTLAVAAGRAALALAPDVAIERVVLVTRDLPVLEGGSTAVLLAGLDLPTSTLASEVLGGCCTVLGNLADARPGTLVIGADVDGGAGAGAAVVGAGGLRLAVAARRDASLPVRVRDAQGNTADYGDPRLLRERGVRQGIDVLGLAGPFTAVAGLAARDARELAPGARPLPTLGASAAFFAVAEAVGGTAPRDGRVVVAVDEAAVCAVTLHGDVAVGRCAPHPRPAPRRRPGAPAELAIALPAYERAFAAKLGLAAGRCAHCGELALPPRRRCLVCGDETGQELVPLPRTGEVYTAVTVHVPVPGLATPYSLAIVELGDSGVRVLVHVTDDDPGRVAIGDRGELVLRLVAVRSGVRDYGYALAPHRAADRTEAAA